MDRLISSNKSLQPNVEGRGFVEPLMRMLRS
jgi:hypothetical protein